MRGLIRGLAAVLLLSALPAAAGEYTALLERIGQAVRGLNYEGIIVYRGAGTMETMRIVHQVIDGREQEYLQSLDGTAREVVREGDRVVCLLDEDRVVLVDHRVAGADFPSRWAMLPAGLERYYEITATLRERVAGRAARLLRIQSRDALRYSHRIWVDEASGLPLRTELVNRDGPPLEVMMFTELQLWPEPDPELLADVLGRMRVALAGASPAARPSTPAVGQWRITALPDGFVAIDQRRQNLPGSDVLVDHLVFSDGLATVSVYVEFPAMSEAMAGGRRLGAVSTYAVRDGERQVVVVGDVPMATARLIGDSVQPR